MTTDSAARPGVIARFKSRQSGHPSGLVGRGVHTGYELHLFAAHLPNDAVTA